MVSDEAPIADPPSPLFPPASSPACPLLAFTPPLPEAAVVSCPPQAATGVNAAAPRIAKKVALRLIGGMVVARKGKGTPRLSGRRRAASERDADHTPPSID